MIQVALRYWNGQELQYGHKLAKIVPFVGSDGYTASLRIEPVTKSWPWSHEKLSTISLATGFRQTEPQHHCLIACPVEIDGGSVRPGLISIEFLNDLAARFRRYCNAKGWNPDTAIANLMLNHQAVLIEAGRKTRQAA